MEEGKEGVAGQEITLTGIIEQVYKSNVNLLELCNRLDAVVDKLLTGEAPHKVKNWVADGCTDQVSGSLPTLNDNAEKYKFLSGHLDELITKLETVIN